MNLPSKKLLLIILVLTGFLVACSNTPKNSLEVKTLKKDLNYNRQNTQSAQSLAIPPQLDSPITSELFANDQKMVNRANQILAAKQSISDVIESTNQVQIKKLGPFRWLEIDAPISKIYPIAQKFLIDLGFNLALDDPAIGVLETDWKENKPIIPKESLGVVRSALQKALQQVFSEGKIDKFRIRIDPINDNQSQVFISHSSMIEEKINGIDVWRFAQSNPELEAELSYRLLIYLGLSENEAYSFANQALTQKQNNETESNYSNTQLGLTYTIEQNFEQAWLMVLWSLDRSDYIVYDRDRAAGIFYIQPSEKLIESKQGFFEKLLFWTQDEKIESMKVKVKLTKNTNQSVNINILSVEGDVLTDNDARVFLADIVRFLY